VTDETTRPFETSWEHISLELVHLDLLLQREVLRWRDAFPKDNHDAFRTVYISDGEVDRLLDDPSVSREAGSSRIEDIETAGAALRRTIDRRRQRSLELHVYLSLPHLARVFGLTPLEERIVVICLAPELELKYERIYSYLQDDISRRNPSVDLVLRLLCDGPAQGIQLRGSLSQRSVLFRSQILRSQETGDQHLPARTIKLDEPIANFLLCVGRADAELPGCVQHADHPLPSTSFVQGLKSKLVDATKNHFQERAPSNLKLIFHFHGRGGTGKKTLAAAISDAIGALLLVADLRELLRHPASFEVALRAIFRQGLLTTAAVYLDHFEELLKDEANAGAYLEVVATCVDDFSWVTFIDAPEYWEPAGLFKDHRFLAVELPVPDVTARAKLWEELAGKSCGAGPDVVDWPELAAKFQLTPGQMKNALTAARNYVHLRGGAGITVDDLNRGCRSQSNQSLATLSRKLAPRYTWPDITLPDNSLAQMREICGQMRHRQTVYESWGFGEKHSLGRGLCVLFFGPSGTGKTMAVEIIASELMLDAYKIDLSTVVSKYIGETERNLRKVFDEAETSNAILFFDEADALFGKRSEVKDAHDRYANIEINYLLQRMEEYQGLAILATNLRKNIDDAFFRRMHFAVEFPLPGQADRYAIWKQHFPSSAPVSADLDFDFLASRLNVTGGNIKNIVMNAAFLAAANSGAINMKHVVHATRREFEKIGRLCTDADFTPYHHLL